jgi:hypothetical protein
MALFESEDLYILMSYQNSTHQTIFFIKKTNYD